MGRMNHRPAASDALVLFGVSGDLAHKMIFPALYAMAKRGLLDIPVVGVASSDWNIDQLRERAADSVKCSDGTRASGHGGSVRNGRRSAAHRRVHAGVIAVAFTGDGRRIGTAAGGDGLVKLWEVAMLRQAASPAGESFRA